MEEWSSEANHDYVPEEARRIINPIPRQSVSEKRQRSGFISGDYEALYP